MPMHPRPSTDTVGPRRPSLRCCILVSSLLVVEGHHCARVTRRVQYAGGGEFAAPLRSRCRIERQPAPGERRQVARSPPIERSRACYKTKVWNTSNTPTRLATDGRRGGGVHTHEPTSARDDSPFAVLRAPALEGDRPSGAAA